MLMAAKPKEPKEKEPSVTGVIYRVRLEYCDPREPLFNVSYIGQAVRVGTGAQVADARWKEEKNKAAREHKQFGFLAALDAFGPSAFRWEILEEMTGERDAVQKWANAREKYHIEAHGGVLKDVHRKCDQTFNQTKGGQGNHWASMDALRTKAWNTFKQELEWYIADVGNALVPSTYVNPITKYTLGTMVGLVRSQGTFLEGHPLRNERIEWLNKQPRWVWNALKTNEWREACSTRVRDRLRKEETVDPGCTSRRMKNTRKREEEENPGVWSRHWANVLTTEVREKRNQTALNKSKDLIADKQRTLSAVDFAKWKYHYDKDKRSQAKKAADLRMVSKIVPEAWKRGIASYRADGTVSIAYAVVDCVQRLLDEVEGFKN